MNDYAQWAAALTLTLHQPTFPKILVATGTNKADKDKTPPLAKLALPHKISHLSAGQALNRAKTER